MNGRRPYERPPAQNEKINPPGKTPQFSAVTGAPQKTSVF
jgi:hypothetical protein